MGWTAHATQQRTVKGKNWEPIGSSLLQQAGAALQIINLPQVGVSSYDCRGQHLVAGCGSCRRLPAATFQAGASVGVAHAAS